MYTKEFYKLFLYLSQLANYLGVSSVKFDIKRKKCYVTLYSRRRTYLLSVLVLLGAILYWTKAYVMYKYHGGHRNPHFHLCYIVCCLATILLMANVFMYFRGEEIAQLFTHVIQHPKRFERMWTRSYYKPERDIYSRTMDIMLFLCCLAALILPWSWTAFYAAFPNNPIFLTSSFPLWIKQTWFWWVIYSVGLVVMTVGAYEVTIAVVTLLTFGITYFFSTLVMILDEFRVGKKLPYRTLKSLRTVHYLPYEYRTVQLIHARMMHLGGWLVPCAHGLLAHTILFWNYVVIKRWHTIEFYIVLMLLMYSVLSQIIWGIVLELGGRFHKRSGAILNSWKFMTFNSPKEKKLMGKIRKSCRPLSLGQKGVFIITRLSVLTFFRGIVVGTVRTLLTLGKEYKG